MSLRQSTNNNDHQSEHIPSPAALGQQTRSSSSESTSPVDNTAHHKPLYKHTPMMRTLSTTTTINMSTAPTSLPTIPTRYSSPPRPVSAKLAYSINMALLDQLFPNTPTPPPPQCYNPAAAPPPPVSSKNDTHIWARGSRNILVSPHRTQRRSGARAVWAESVVRREVVAIVRRWLDEASAGHRDGFVFGVGFGGGGGGGDGCARVFNWDEAADAPVSLDALFGPRRDVATRVGAGEETGPATAVVVRDTREVRETSRWSLAAPPGGGSPTRAQAESPVSFVRETPRWEKDSHLQIADNDDDDDGDDDDDNDDDGDDGDDDDNDNDDDEWGEMVSFPAVGHVIGDADSGFASWVTTTTPPLRDGGDRHSRQSSVSVSPSMENQRIRTESAPPGPCPGPGTESDADTEALARLIVDNLSDLSYMLQ